MVLMRMEGQVEELEKNYRTLKDRVAAIDVQTGELKNNLKNSKAHTCKRFDFIGGNLYEI